MVLVAIQPSANLRPGYACHVMCCCAGRTSQGSPLCLCNIRTALDAASCPSRIIAASGKHHFTASFFLPPRKPICPQLNTHRSGREDGTSKCLLCSRGASDKPRSGSHREWPGVGTLPQDDMLAFLELDKCNKCNTIIFSRCTEQLSRCHIWVKIQKWMRR